MQPDPRIAPFPVSTHLLTCESRRGFSPPVTKHSSISVSCFDKHDSLPTCAPQAWQGQHTQDSQHILFGMCCTQAFGRAVAIYDHDLEMQRVPAPPDAGGADACVKTPKEDYVQCL
eukprot:1142153-Pelagomonas_calceolata.AAC.1